MNSSRIYCKWHVALGLVSIHRKGNRNTLDLSLRTIKLVIEYFRNTLTSFVRFLLISFYWATRNPAIPACSCTQRNVPTSSVRFSVVPIMYYNLVAWLPRTATKRAFGGSTGPSHFQGEAPMGRWLAGSEERKVTAKARAPPLSVIHVPFGHCGLLLLLGVEHFGQKIKLINFDLLK